MQPELEDVIRALQQPAGEVSADDYLVACCDAVRLRAQLPYRLLIRVPVDPQRTSDPIWAYIVRETAAASPDGRERLIQPETVRWEFELDDDRLTVVAAEAPVYLKTAGSGNQTALACFQVLPIPCGVLGVLLDPFVTAQPGGPPNGLALYTFAELADAIGRVFVHPSTARNGADTPLMRFVDVDTATEVLMFEPDRLVVKCTPSESELAGARRIITREVSELLH